MRALIVTCDKMKTEKELGWGNGGQSHLGMVNLRFLLNIQLEMVSSNLGRVKERV